MTRHPHLDAIPTYRQRRIVRPGIAGLAQVDGGHAEGVDATVEKTWLDPLLSGSGRSCIKAPPGGP